MEMANNMKELTQNILSSSEERAEELTKIKEGTNTLRKEAVDMVQDFHDSRRKSGEQLRKGLAQGSKLLVQNEKKRKQEVGKMLGTFQKSREETGAELRKNLAEGQAEIKSDVKEALTGARTLINDFQSTRQQMATELKNDLDKSRGERQADVEGMRDDFRKAQTEVQADLKGASDAWKEMGSTMRKKTSGGKAAQGIPVDIPPNLEEKLLSIVNQHAEGITLSEVAKELGIVTIVLGKAAKVLLEQDKVRKEGKTYFPVTT